jgi:hypothetical protein
VPLMYGHPLGWTVGEDTTLLVVVVHVPFHVPVQVPFHDPVQVGLEPKLVALVAAEFIIVLVLELVSVVEFIDVVEFVYPEEVVVGAAETDSEVVVGDAVVGPDHSVHDPFHGPVQEPVHEPIHEPVQLGAAVGADVFIAEIAERMLDVRFWVTVTVVMAPGAVVNTVVGTYATWSAVIVWRD